jgi:predicted nucleic acid-binding Zn ribbon protein
MTQRTTKRAKYCSPACKESARTTARRSAILASRPPRACLVCGATIEPARKGNAVCCSTACRIRLENRKRSAIRTAARAAVVRHCERCSKPIPAERSRRARYCSWECKHRTMNDRYRAREPGYQRERLYGITTAQYDAMLAAQGGCCAICRSATTNGRGGFQVDHDHATGAVRGILCNSCNQGLGRFRDDPALLLKAAAYLGG